MSSTRNTEKVTCRTCMTTKGFKDAVKGKISKLSPDNQKRAKVYAAGATPGIGPALAIHQAAVNAPPGQKVSAGALQGGGWGAGYVGGAALGAHAAARASKVPEVGRKMDAFSAGVRQRRQNVADKLPGFAGRRVAPKTGPGRVGRTVTGLAGRPGAVGRFMKPLAERPGAAGLGGVAGKIAGAGVGGYLGYSEALRREHDKAAKLNSVGKAIANNTGMTQREQREQLKRKRHNLGISMVATGVGATGAGLLAARELGPRLPKVGPTVARHAAGLERAGLATALGGGGIGSYQGAQSARIQRRDLDAQERSLAKARGGSLIPAHRAAGMRSSFIRRTASGPVRVANAVTKADDKPLRPRRSVAGTGIGSAGYGLRPRRPKLDVSRADALRARKTGLGSALVGGGIMGGSYGLTRKPKFDGNAWKLGMTPAEKEARNASRWKDAEEAIGMGSKIPLIKMDSAHFANLPELRRAEDRTEADVVAPASRPLTNIRRRLGSGKGTVVRRVAKLDTTMSDRDAQGVKAKYGVRGPLPAGLPREEKMRAYEGRYIAAGGKKGEHWQRRSDDLDHVTGATIAGAVGAYGAKRAAENPRTAAHLVRRGVNASHLAHRSSRVAESLGAAGALSELAHRHAQHKASSYRSSPAGVAASSLKRMRDYTP